MSNPQLSPIALFTYNRLLHTKKTIEALKKNKLANESDLFIYSDGIKDNHSSYLINKLRTYLKTITGFKSITIIERDKNWGLANSIIDGVTEIVSQFGKIIVLEDDLITSPFFLQFMNDSLKYHNANQHIFTISGYSNILINNKIYEKKSYLAHISSSWGWATWSDRWDTINWSNESYLKILENTKLIKKYTRMVGKPRCDMLQSQMNGSIDSWAVRRLFSQLIQKKMTLFPTISLVKNIGFDGSGTHCGNIPHFDENQNLIQSNPFRKEQVTENPYINKLIIDKNKQTIITKIKVNIIQLLRKHNE